MYDRCVESAVSEESYDQAVRRRYAEIEAERRLHTARMVKGDFVRCGCGLEASRPEYKIHLQVLEQEWAIPAGVEPPRSAP